MNFKMGRGILAQGRGSVVYITMELDSNVDTIVCGSNCIVMHFMGKECDVAPYIDVYDTINAVPIVQAAIAYDNPETS